MRIPIACTLQLSDAETQLGEWRAMLRQVVDRSVRISPIRLELVLLPDADLRSLTDLAQREAACCPFIMLAIEIRADHLVLAVEVPTDAVEVLDDLGSYAAI